MYVTVERVDLTIMTIIMNWDCNNNTKPTPINKKTTKSKKEGRKKVTPGTMRMVCIAHMTEIEIAKFRARS